MCKINNNSNSSYSVYEIMNIVDDYINYIGIDDLPKLEFLRMHSFNFDSLSYMRDKIANLKVANLNDND